MNAQLFAALRSWRVQVRWLRQRGVVRDIVVRIARERVFTAWRTWRAVDAFLRDEEKLRAYDNGAARERAYELVAKFFRRSVPPSSSGRALWDRACGTSGRRSLARGRWFVLAPQSARRERARVSGSARVCPPVGGGGGGAVSLHATPP